ncbi:MAG: hypothetical protein IJ019_03575 [Alphaproteobacteria bacterium]|nr:hypothetical protein [Alphaproteobacteria bacterium]
MRKYFLTSAVSLLIATNVNAQIIDAAGQFMATVVVSTATKLECTGQLAAQLLVTDVTQEMSVTVNPEGYAMSDGSNAISVSGDVPTCTLSNGIFDDVNNIQITSMNASEEDSFKLVHYGETSDTNLPTLSNIKFLLSEDKKSVNIGGTFNIPANLNLGTFNELENFAQYMTYLNIAYVSE